MFAEDISAFFADGVPASYGSQTAQVILDMPDQSILGDMQLSTEFAMTFAATDLVGIKHSDAVIVAGQAYTVREVVRLDDGAIKRATLSRA